MVLTLRHSSSPVSWSQLDSPTRMPACSPFAPFLRAVRGIWWSWACTGAWASRRAPKSPKDMATSMTPASLAQFLTCKCSACLISVSLLFSGFFLLPGWWYRSGPSLSSTTFLSYCYLSSSLPAHTVPPRKAPNHAQSTHNAHTASFVEVPSGFGGRTAAPEGNRLDQAPSRRTSGRRRGPSSPEPARERG